MAFTLFGFYLVNTLSTVEIFVGEHPLRPGLTVQSVIVLGLAGWSCVQAVRYKLATEVEKEVVEGLHEE